MDEAGCKDSKTENLTEIHELTLSTSSLENAERDDAKEGVRRRCRHERLLVIRLFVAKLSLFVSVSSILIMMVNTQLIVMNIYTTCSDVSLALKATGSALTGSLLVLIWLYNYLQLQIFRCLRNIDSLCIALQVNPQRSILLLLETLITIPHPLPICLLPAKLDGKLVSPFMNEHESSSYNETTAIFINFTAPPVNANNTNPDSLYVETATLNQLDSVLAVLMFVRLYHIARFTVLHSKLFRTMLSYSLGALAHTKYNFLFIFKSYMAIYKGYFLATLAMAFTFIAAWCIYICDKDITRYEDALWVVGITFFTVGKFTLVSQVLL